MLKPGKVITYTLVGEEEEEHVAKVVSLYKDEDGVEHISVRDVDTGEWWDGPREEIRVVGEKKMKKKAIERTDIHGWLYKGKYFEYEEDEGEGIQQFGWVLRVDQEADRMDVQPVICYTNEDGQVIPTWEEDPKKDAFYVSSDSVQVMEEEEED